MKLCSIITVFRKYSRAGGYLIPDHGFNCVAQRPACLHIPLPPPDKCLGPPQTNPGPGSRQAPGAVSTKPRKTPTSTLPSPFPFLLRQSSVIRTVVEVSSFDNNVPTRQACNDGRFGQQSSLIIIIKRCLRTFLKCGSQAYSSTYCEY